MKKRIKILQQTDEVLEITKTDFANKSDKINTIVLIIGLGVFSLPFVIYYWQKDEFDYTILLFLIVMLFLLIPLRPGGIFFRDPTFNELKPTTKLNRSSQPHFYETSEVFYLKPKIVMSCDRGVAAADPAETQYYPSAIAINS